MAVVLLALLVLSEAIVTEGWVETRFICPVNTVCFKRPVNCEQNDCEYFVSAKENPRNSNQIIIDLKGRSDGWIALGLSHDEIAMHEDDVMMCIRRGEYVTLERRWNTGGLNHKSSSQAGVTAYGNAYSYQNGMLRCQFVRERQLPQDPLHFFEMDSQYHWIVNAKGPVSPTGKPLQHTRYPCISSQQVTVTDNMPIAACTRREWAGGRGNRPIGGTGGGGAGGGAGGGGGGGGGGGIVIKDGGGNGGYEGGFGDRNDIKRNGGNACGYLRKPALLLVIGVSTIVAMVIM
ncbi:ferric-chelate reductase 1-like [Anneissia japonica]|uniref:ferric-chelate reductase 1-like n=1 Tax=Anneissia japonica TaxID=1529436 RepID=UPI0014258907|nr:ferric-chelate reductase 1-like [Anneissia japonica]